ncbi:Glycosyltransferase family 2 protein OS=Streptomyces rimosus subsp. rimosus (strain ATCC/ DSM 40260 / JCM 4667 / NRRL 2234) OX=1265868 GN=SRIM_008325 PE=4 SV=1 [Streptomyces rimosus subsp. rimosus]
MPDAVLLVDDRSVIHHRVPGDRERFAYFRSRTYAEGLSKALVTRSVGTRDGLSAERRYTTRVLPAGVARGVRDALLRRPGGAGRAGAIVAGVSSAAFGYALGSLRARRDRRTVGSGFVVVPVPDGTGGTGREPAGPLEPAKVPAPATPPARGESSSSGSEGAVA